MKVLVNGGLNLGELDGWWAEAYTPEVGWALGDGREHDDDPAWDATEADQLYHLLETGVVPEFYQVDQNGIPKTWVARMRESMARLAPRFSADRTVREYTENYYLPAATALHERSADHAAQTAQIFQWRNALHEHWSALRFGEMKTTTTGQEHLFEVQVYLDDLEPDWVRVELYADAINGGEPVRQAMTRARPLVGSASGYLYSAKVAAMRPAADYTPRLVPHHPGVATPLETNLILWQR